MNKRLIIFTTVILLLSAALLVVKQPKVEANTRDFDWVITVTTEELKDYFTFPGTNLNPIVKVKVTYQDKKTTKNEEVPYEDLYFRGCEAVGLRRYSVLNINNTGLGAIRIQHKTSDAGSGETCSAANAITRLLLDTYILGDAPSVVLVPRTSFGPIAQDLRRENFFPFESGADQAIPASIILSLASEPDGNRQSMYYNGGN